MIRLAFDTCRRNEDNRVRVFSDVDLFTLIVGCIYRFLEAQIPCFLNLIHSPVNEWSGICDSYRCLMCTRFLLVLCPLGYFLFSYGVRCYRQKQPTSTCAHLTPTVFRVDLISVTSFNRFILRLQIICEIQMI